VKRTVLLASYGGGHAHMLPPVVKALRRRASDAGVDLDLRILGFGPAKWIFERHGLSCLTYKNFLETSHDGDALAWGEELAEQHHSATAVPDRSESVAYLGLSFKDLVGKHGEMDAKALLAKRGRQAFFPTTILERVFDRIRPHLLITTNSPRSEAAAIDVARRRNIDQIIMTDLFAGRGDYILRAQHITFLNDRARQRHLEDGLYDPMVSTPHVTGNPAFDVLHDLPRNLSADWADQEFRQAGGRPLVLFADMPAYWHTTERRSYFRSEVEIIAELDAVASAVHAQGCHLLVRPHPSQDRAFYEKWLVGKPMASLAAQQPLHDVLRGCTLLIVRSSTVGLEAVYLGKRVLQLDSAFHSDVPFASLGVAWGADSFPNLEAAVAAALHDEAGFARIQRRIAEVLPPVPAADRIVDLIFKRLATIPSSA